MQNLKPLEFGAPFLDAGTADLLGSPGGMWAVGCRPGFRVYITKRVHMYDSYKIRVTF